MRTKQHVKTIANAEGIHSLRPDQIIVETPKRTVTTDVSDLKEKIRLHGSLICPIVVDQNNRLLSGERRLLACKDLGWKTIPVVVLESDTPHNIGFDAHYVRKDYAPSEIVSLTRYLLGEERKLAEKRRRANLTGEVAEGEIGRAIDIIARRYDLSGKSLYKAFKVADAAVEDPSKFADLVRQMDEGSIDAAYQELVRRQTGDMIKRANNSTAQVKTSCIVADPFRDEISATDIERVDLSTIDHRESLLWLWTDLDRLADALPMLLNWEYDYVRSLISITGAEQRTHVSICLVGKRGDPHIRWSRIPVVVHDDQARGRKGFYDLVESVCGGKGMQLLDRKTMKDWSVWGEEASE